MTKTIEYFYALASPWTYLGHKRLVDMAARHGADINFRPVALQEIFKLTGGLPLLQRHEFRRKYRMDDLIRWKRRLKSDIVLEPAFFPADDTLARKAVISAGLMGLDPEPITFWYHQAIWVDDQNIADEAIVRAGLEACALPADEIMTKAHSQEAADQLALNTQEALGHSVIGSPWYVVEGEGFWGQDRLDFVEEKLAG